MKSLKKILIYGVLIWVIPFVVGILAFPIKDSLPALFESIMAVVIAVCVVCFGVRYFRAIEAPTLKRGVLLGVIWLGISVVLDLPMFMWGPMKMALGDYVMDIGVTYLMIPVVTIGLGWQVSRRVDSEGG